MCFGRRILVLNHPKTPLLSLPIWQVMAVTRTFTSFRAPSSFWAKRGWYRTYRAMMGGTRLDNFESVESVLPENVWKGYKGNYKVPTEVKGLILLYMLILFWYRNAHCINVTFSKNTVHTVNSCSASHDNWCTATLWNRIMTAQCEGMGEVGSARYEPALLPPCPSIRVLSYSNCQEIHSRQQTGLAVQVLSMLVKSRMT